MKEVRNNYLNDRIKYDKWQVIGILGLIIAISGFFGWVYEYIFYYINGGMKYFYWRGGNFLPWINIYAIGSIMIILLSYKFKKKPLLVFLIAFISTGILEYFSGLAIYKILNGTRFWDYNTEILNFGNIDGFICLRSVTFFGLSGLLLMYFILPFCMFLSVKMKRKKFLIISLFLGSLFLFDEFYNLVISHIFKTPNAIEVYKNFEFHFMNILSNFLK